MERKSDAVRERGSRKMCMIKGPLFAFNAKMGLSGSECFLYDIGHGRIGRNDIM